MQSCAWPSQWPCHPIPLCFSSTTCPVWLRCTLLPAALAILPKVCFALEPWQEELSAQGGSLTQHCLLFPLHQDTLEQNIRSYSTQLSGAIPVKSQWFSVGLATLPAHLTQVEENNTQRGGKAREDMEVHGGGQQWSNTQLCASWLLWSRRLVWSSVAILTWAGQKNPDTLLKLVML